MHARPQKTLSENLTWDLKLSGTVWSKRKAALCHILPMAATLFGETLSSLSVSHILSKLSFDQSICAFTTLKKAHGPKGLAEHPLCISSAKMKSTASASITEDLSSYTNLSLHKTTNSQAEEDHWSNTWCWSATLDTELNTPFPRSPVCLEPLKAQVVSSGSNESPSPRKMDKT